MNNKILKYAIGIVGAGSVAGLFLSQTFAAASTTVTLPSGFTASIIGAVGNQLADPELLILVGVVSGLYVTFWAIHKVIALVPKGR